MDLKAQEKRDRRRGPERVLHLEATFHKVLRALIRIEIGRAHV